MADKHLAGQHPDGIERAAPDRLMMNQASAMQAVDDAIGFRTRGRARQQPTSPSAVGLLQARPRASAPQAGPEQEPLRGGKCSPSMRHFFSPVLG